MNFFIFGSTGDLIKRKVVPALSHISLPDLEIIALGRKDFLSDSYNNFICEGGTCFDKFNKKPQYNIVNFNNEIVCDKCIEQLDRENINFFYSAMPPKSIIKILKYIGKIKKDGFKVKVLIEKPIGENLVSAHEIKETIKNQNLTDDIFISDHYVFKDEIEELKDLNFKKIKLVFLENVGLENRVGYYDDIGALKDMVQSHFMNIIFKIGGFSSDEFKNIEIVDVVRAQYGNGTDSGYVKDLGKKSDTETFIKVKLKTKTKEIEFITGKKFNEKLSFIEIDNKKIIIRDNKNPYEKLLSDFFLQKKENFPTLDMTILAWEIVEKINNKKSTLQYYKENSKVEDFV